MNKSGEIVIVEDDADDQQFISEAIAALKVKNAVQVFSNGATAYAYLNSQNSSPFIIISDINMPLMTGIELKDKLQQQQDPKLKNVPFLFLTTAHMQGNSIAADIDLVQGYFTKPDNYEALKRLLKIIFDYWNLYGASTFR